MKKLKIGLGVRLLFLISIVISLVVGAYTYFFPPDSPPEQQQEEEPVEHEGATLDAYYDPVSDTWYVS